MRRLSFYRRFFTPNLFNEFAPVEKYLAHDSLSGVDTGELETGILFRAALAISKRALASAFCSSVITRGVLNGFLPRLNGYSGQSLTGHAFTSSELPPEQSIHFALIALPGDLISLLIFISPIKLDRTKTRLRPRTASPAVSCVATL